MTSTDRDPRWQINDGRLRSFRSADCQRTVLLSVEEYEQRRPGLILHEWHQSPEAPVPLHDSKEARAIGDRTQRLKAPSIQ